MKNITRKPMLLLLVTGILVLVAAEPGEYNKIDAFTSATKYLKVDSIIVYRNKAIVYWYEWWEEDITVRVYQLRWGLKSSASFDDSLDLKGYQNKTHLVDTIQPLTDSTEYTGQFNRNWKGKLFNFDFTFNTPPMQTGISFSRPQLSRPSKMAGIAIHTIDGKLIATRNVSRRSAIAASVGSAVRTPGLYIVNIMDMHGNLLAAETILTGN